MAHTNQIRITQFERIIYEKISVCSKFNWLFFHHRIFARMLSMDTRNNRLPIWKWNLCKLMECHATSSTANGTRYSMKWIFCGFERDLNYVKKQTTSSSSIARQQIFVPTSTKKTILNNATKSHHRCYARKSKSFSLCRFSVGRWIPYFLLELYNFFEVISINLCQRNTH